MATLAVRLRGAARSSVVPVLVGQAALSGANFVTLWSLGRWAGPTELGLYALGASVCFLAHSLADTLVTTPYTFHAGQDEPFAPDGVMVAAWGMVALGLLVATGLALARHLGLNDLQAVWPALPVAVAALLVRELFRRHWLVRGDTHALMVQDLATATLQGVGLVGLVLAGHWSAFGAFGVMAGASLLPLLPLLRPRSRWRRLGAAWPHVGSGLGALLAYGRWLLLGGLLHVTSMQTYPWLAAHSGGVKQAGLFAACNSLVNLMSPLLTGLTNHDRPLFMQAARRGPSALRHFLRQRLGLFVLPAAVLWVLAQGAGGWVLTRLYGPAFTVAGPTLAWMALGTVAVAVAAPLQLALLALRAPVSNPLHHGSAVAVLAGVWLATGGAVSLTAMGPLYAGANGLATALLAGMFWVWQDRRRQRAWPG